MLINGPIDVDEAGKVTANAVERSENVPSEVHQLLTQAIPRWLFEPLLVEGTRPPCAPRYVPTPLGGNGRSHALQRSHLSLAVHPDSAYGGTEGQGLS